MFEQLPMSFFEFSDHIRVVIADDHPIFRKGLKTILCQNGLDIVSEAENGKQLISIVEREKPDIVIADIQMPQMDGIEAIRIINNILPGTGTIALSKHKNEPLICKAIEAGANCCLYKGAEISEILVAIRAARMNENYFPANTLSRVIEYIKPDRTKLTLTSKEIKVIKLICEQNSSKEIAGILNSSIRSVESARERIQEKTGAKNMVGIAVYAIKKGIVSIDELAV